MAKPESNEIRIVRVYDAPVEMVWDAWTDPAQVAQWWGPRGFTLTTHSKDLRVGGIWHYTMHGPDGKDWINKTLYHEVIPQKKLVYDHGGNDEQAPLFRVTALFKDLGDGRTELEMSMGFPTAEVAKEMGQFIKKAGGESTWDRLAEYLGKNKDGKDQFVINRSFDAPLELVYEMWTNPEHFSKWLPPTGMTMEFIKADIRPGGRTFYMMSGNNIKMYGCAEYRELRKPDRLVYTQQFRDENDKISRHPLAPTWPETMLTTVTLTSEGSDRTRVTVAWEAFGPMTREELECFLNARAGMTAGWTGSFDKLEEYLLKR